MAGPYFKFETPAELQAGVDAYFDSCFAPIKDSEGKETDKTMQFKPFTVGGLAVFLDMTRQSILNYAKKGEFAEIITKAKAKIEAYAEEQLFRPSQVAGVIFNLKNNYKGWVDKAELQGDMSLNIIRKSYDDKKGENDGGS